MRGSKIAAIWLGAVLCSAARMAWAGEVVAAPPGIRELTEQLEELKERVDEVRERRDELREEIRKSPQIIPLREASDRAEAAYQDAKRVDEAYTAAIKADEQAREAFEKLVKEKLAADAKRLLEELEAVRQKATDSEDAAGEIRREIADLRRKIEKSDDLGISAARARREAAAKALREAYESEALNTFRKARDKAREAYEAKVGELEKASPELAAAMKEREELRIRVRELEKRVGELPAVQKEEGAAQQGFVAGPYLIQLGSDCVTVAWETDAPSTGMVEYYVDPDQRQFRKSEREARLHRVNITGLPPATACWYRVQVGAESTPFSQFTTARAGPAPFHFAVYGDSRSNPRYHARIARAILSHHPAFVVHTGDLVADGRDAKQWAPQFFRPAAELLRECPIIPAMGTHDGNSVLFHRYFGLTREPTEAERQGDATLLEMPIPAWFVWTYGSLDVFVLNSYAPYRTDSPQWRWLSTALASSRARWRAAVVHKTVYSSGRHGGSESLRRYLLPLLLKHGVDIIFAGHEHIYERTYAISSGPQASSNALVEIVTGGGGASLYKVNPGPWTAYASSQRNYCIVGIDGDRLSVMAYDERGDPFDCIVMNKHEGKREFGEVIPAVALEFLQSVKHFTSISFPHAQSNVRSREFSFTVRNPYADELRGELSWEIPNRAWSIDPPSQRIRVAPGKSERVAFTVRLEPPADGAAVAPLPRAILTAGGRSVTTPAFVLERPPRSSGQAP